MTSAHIPDRRRVPCAFDCGNDVDTEATTTYQYVAGWARNRAQGGTNALALREPERRWACHVCIDRLTSGIATAQTDLFA